MRHGRQGVGQPGPRNDKGHANTTRSPRVAIGHEASRLLVARCHVADAGRSQAPVELQRVNAGNAKDDVYAAFFQPFDQCLTNAAHAVPLLSLVAEREDRERPGLYKRHFGFGGTLWRTVVDFLCRD